MSLILDAGAFIAFERGDKLVGGLIAVELAARRPVTTHGGIVGQVWRSATGRQVRLVRLLDATRVVALDHALGRRAGLLLGRSARSDVIDAALVLLASDGDTVLTSDPDDLAPLADAAGLHVDIVAV